MIIPPGGLAGFAQMTPASKIALAGTRAAPARRRRRSTRKAAASPTRSRKSNGRKPKFGSPSWQKKYKVGRFAKKR